jgi:hypothetical protein
MFSVLPLLIVIVLISGVVFVFKSKKKTKSYMGSKKIKWLLGIYVIILFIAGLLSFIVLPGKLNIREQLSEDEIHKYQQAQDRVYESINNGRFSADDYKDVLMKKNTYSFQYDQEELKVSFMNEEQVGATVLVEQKKNDDGKLEAVYYTGRFIIDGVDISQLVTAPSIQLEENSLKVGSINMEEIKMAKLSAGLPFNQFSRDARSFSDGHYSYGEAAVLYLKVPKGVMVSGFYMSVN